ncbi:gp16 family protein [Lysobacter sp. CA199]|uniref:gp16 family protein n=1 Tax=Lysobacter sp. CA199 TaxID=3455608 RepID=UPI003F8D0C4C
MPKSDAAATVRKHQLGRIHQAKKALRLDDETYREILVRVTGKASSAAMSGSERRLVIDEFDRLMGSRTGSDAKPAGTKAGRRNFPGRPKRTDDVPMLQKIEALLTDRRLPWSYVNAMAKRMFDCDRVDWLNDQQLHDTVAALQKSANRKAK